jgi:cation diffusion facilitator CzcD-associated flavoprotein CzcO
MRKAIDMTARVCIIGAGSSGIAAAQVLRSRGIDFDCFELGSEVGGNWRYQNDNGMSSAYRSLHINTSRQLMEYRAYPMPDDLPDYPNHWQIAKYFDDYVDHFGFRDKIRFRTEVVKVEPMTAVGEDAGGPSGTLDRYAVTLRSRNEHGETSEPETRHYEYVIVANGHHWDPRWPEPSFPGAETFRGEQIHAHYYKTPEIFEDKRVLVLGIGNSACDISVESSRVAEETYLAMRRGAYIVPKYLLGVPTDHLTDSVVARMPLKVQQLSMATMLRLAQGKVSDYGLPEPDHAVLHAHPTVSDDLLTRLGHGDITVKPNIDRFEGSKVFFEDGSAAEVDIVVYCTGYKVTFPFFDEKVVKAEDNHIDLYRRVVDPEHPGLYFVGLIQPLGAIMPLAEAQAEWVGDLIGGVGELPSYDRMRAQIEEYDEELRKRYVASKRHTIQVDFHKYLAEIERERRASKARAQGRPATRSAQVREGVRGGVRALTAAARNLRS